MERIGCFLIGYFLGCILTAEIVAHVVAGMSSSEIGTSGNPGMANIMTHLGFKPGIIVLAGDIGKTILSCLIGWLLFHRDLGRLAIYWAMFGATIGHCFPFWRKLSGGKGVATSCIGLFLFSPGWGLIAVIIGMLAVFATGYLCVGGALIPAAFILPAFLVYGEEAGILTIALTALCVYKHLPGLKGVLDGSCEKTDVLGAIKKKFFTKKA